MEVGQAPVVDLFSTTAALALVRWRRGSRSSLEPSER
jgi:hypothetical protein